MILFVIYNLACRCFWYLSGLSKISSKDKYVLITGCDTGVGHALAIELDREGFNVIAGVLIYDNLIPMKSQLSSRAIVLHLDITKQEDIDNVFKFVKERTNNLYGLVNNAGIMTHGCIDWTSMEMMRKVMDVNFFGHVAMTKTLLPLLITKSDSRVVNVVSAAGFFSFPNTSAYSGSKHALKSFSDCLRREMAPWNLRVSTIEPGALQTPMLANYEEDWRNIWNKLPNDIQQRWGIDYLNSIIRKSVNSIFMIYADHPSRVVNAIRHALINTKPNIHYRPGWQAQLFFYILYFLPTWLSDQLIGIVFNFVPAGAQYQ